MTIDNKEIIKKYKKSKRYCKGKLYDLKNWDKFDQWYDEVERSEGKWLKSELHYGSTNTLWKEAYGYVWVSNDVYKHSCSLDRDNLILLK